MKISEVNFDLLSNEDINNIVTYNVNDYNYNNSRQDGIISLGCSPILLNDRILKMNELLNNNVSNNVLLSGGVSWHKFWLNNDAKRIEYAKDIERILNIAHDDNNVNMLTNLTESQLMLLFLKNVSDLDSINIYLDNLSSNTHENAFYCKEILDKKLEKYNSLVVITTAWHVRRTFLTFKKQFQDKNIIVTPSTSDLDRKSIQLNDVSFHDFYKGTIIDECKKIINYSRNGDIADLELNDFLNDEISEKIERGQAKVRKPIGVI